MPNRSWHITTPAPDRQEAFAYSIRRNDGWAIAEVCKWPNNAARVARLIAAAPDMREMGNHLAMLALESDRYVYDSEYHEVVDNWLALLNRIDGGGDDV